MAANNIEDEDSWLYGNNDTSPEKKENETTEEPPKDSKIEEKEVNANAENVDDTAEVTSQDQGKEAGELSGEEPDTSAVTEGDGEEEGEDSDSDDDVQVTIKELNSTSGYGSYTAPVNLNITKRVPYAQTGGINQTNSITISKSKGLDMEAAGSINGVPVYDFNLDTLEDKPWMKPGADITDYFNYGFQEDSWKIYCEKQRKLRSDLSTGTGLLTVKTGKEAVNALPTVNENSKYSGPTATPNVVLTKKAGPPPGRKMSGCIDVIGGGAPSSLASRRVNATPPKESPIQVMTGRTPSGPPAVMPPRITSMPPPGYLGPPQNMSIPPPRMMPPGIPGGPPPPLGMPPPNLSIPPPSFPDMYNFNRFPPPPGQNNSAPHQHSASSNSKNDDFDDRAQSFEDQFGNSSYDNDRDRESRRDWERKDSPTRDRDSERHRDSGRERERERERSRSPEEHDRRHREHRDRDYEYDRRDRDRDRRHRDRDRDKDREDRHRSRRRHRDEDDHERDDSGERHRSSRHKRKRTSRRDREEGEDFDSKDTGESETNPALDDMHD